MESSHVVVLKESKGALKETGTASQQQSSYPDRNGGKDCRTLFRASLKKVCIAIEEADEEHKEIRIENTLIDKGGHPVHLNAGVRYSHARLENVQFYTALRNRKMR